MPHQTDGPESVELKPTHDGDSSSQQGRSEADDNHAKDQNKAQPAEEPIEAPDKKANIWLVLISRVSCRGTDDGSSYAGSA